MGRMARPHEVGTSWPSSPPGRRLHDGHDGLRQRRDHDAGPGLSGSRRLPARGTTARRGIIAAMVAETAQDLLRGRDALAAADWEGARSLFERAGELGETAEVLDGLSQAAHFQGQYARRDRVEGARVRGVPAARRSRGGRRAGPLAGVPPRHGPRQHGRRQRLDGTRRAPARGVDECAAHGWLTLDHATVHPRRVGAREARRPRRSPSAGGSATPTSSSTRWPCWARSMWPRDASPRGCGSSTRRWPRSPGARSSASARSARSSAGC